MNEDPKGKKKKIMSIIKILKIIINFVDAMLKEYADEIKKLKELLLR